MWIIILSVLLFLVSCLCVALMVTLAYEGGKQKQHVFYNPSTGVLSSDCLDDLKAAAHAMEDRKQPGADA